MKHSTVSVFVLAIVLSLSALVFAQGEKPDATLQLSEGQVAAGIGWSWGKGVLNFNGEEYPFKVKGLSVLDVGVTKAEATGKVYNLKKLSDFNGTYAAAAAEGTAAKGAGVSTMQNENGVLIHLVSKTKGANLKFATEGVKFTLE
jgi:hypothetical protein